MESEKENQKIQKKNKSRKSHSNWLHLEPHRTNIRSQSDEEMAEQEYLAVDQATRITINQIKRGIFVLVEYEWNKMYATM